jgi:hypothetical protein
MVFPRAARPISRPGRRLAELRRTPRRPGLSCAFRALHYRCASLRVARPRRKIIRSPRRAPLARRRRPLSAPAPRFALRTRQDAISKREPESSQLGDQKPLSRPLRRAARHSPSAFSPRSGPRPAAAAPPPAPAVRTPPRAAPPPPSRPPETPPPCTRTAPCSATAPPAPLLAASL